MKKLVLVLLATVSLASVAQAQCSGSFNAGEFCGNSTASDRLAKREPASPLFDRAFGSTDNSVLTRATTWAGRQTLPNAVQDNITRTGTVATGTWQGTAIDATRGGFGGSVAASNGVPLFATGTPTFTSTSGTGVFLRATAPSLTAAPADGDNTTKVPTTSFIHRYAKFVTPEQFGALGTCGATDDTTAVQAAINTGSNVFTPNCYRVSGLTITSAFNGRSLFGAGGFHLEPIGNVPVITLDSTAAEISRVGIRDIGFLGSNGTATEIAIKFTGANYIQHSSYSNIKCQNIHTCVKNTSTAASGQVNWSLFTNFQILQSTQYAVIFDGGSGTGNVFSNFSCLVQEDCLVFGISTTTGDIGDLVFNGIHVGSGNTGSGIVLNTNSGYAENITFNGTQFDAGAGCGIEFTGTATWKRVSGGGNNWGGALIAPMCFGGSTGSQGFNVETSYVYVANLAGNTDNYAPVSGSAQIIPITKTLVVSPNADMDYLGGIIAQHDGHRIELVNGHVSNNLVVSHDKASSTAANRIFSGGDITLAPRQMLLLRYYKAIARWLVVKN